MTFSAWLVQRSFIARHRSALHEGAYRAYRTYQHMAQLSGVVVSDPMDYEAWRARCIGFLKACEITRVRL